uniref:Uncharacterized protein n=1 Tax=Enterobacter cloacae TaxID=550 RepID=A0A125S6J8_ENTCL|nr:hypothetical protein [Enterobacter cloacae]AME15648.1 hypothetical protein PIMI5_00011 [Enterobacter cloacae]
MEIVDEAQLSEQQQIDLLMSALFMEDLAVTCLCHNCSESITIGCFCDPDAVMIMRKGKNYMCAGWV